jgi:hypothetical protein
MVSSTVMAIRRSCETVDEAAILGVPQCPLW